MTETSMEAAMWLGFVTATGGDKDQAGCALAYDLLDARTHQSGGYVRRVQPTRVWPVKTRVEAIDIPPPDEDGR